MFFVSVLQPHLRPIAVSALKGLLGGAVQHGPGALIAFHQYRQGSQPQACDSHDSKWPVKTQRQCDECPVLQIDPEQLSKLEGAVKSKVFAAGVAPK